MGPETDFKYRQIDILKIDVWTGCDLTNHVMQVPLAWLITRRRVLLVLMITWTPGSISSDDHLEAEDLSTHHGVALLHFILVSLRSLLSKMLNIYGWAENS